MKQKQSNIKGFVIIIAGIIAGIALDQYTKWLAVKHLKDQDAYTIIGVFSASNIWRTKVQLSA